MQTNRANLIIVIFGLFTGCFMPVSGLAMSGRVAVQCDTAARSAAARTGVPWDILLAVTRAESGRTIDGRFHSWPWTVNAAGKGHWFPTRTAAHDYIQKQSEAGLRNFDIGCFQVNYRWHARGFSSVDAMLDPTKNALYAAQFLRRLHAETGDWALAIGAYHSRTPKYANRYKARVRRIRAQLQAGHLARTKPAIPLRPTLKPGVLVQVSTEGSPRRWLGSTTSLIMQTDIRPLIDLSPRRSVME